jgi:hypothetical protein
MAVNLIRTALGHGEAKALDETESDPYATPEPRGALAPAE